MASGSSLTELMSHSYYEELGFPRSKIAVQQLISSPEALTRINSQLHSVEFSKNSLVLTL